MALDKNKRGFGIDLENRLKRPTHEDSEVGKEETAKEQEDKNPVEETPVVTEPSEAPEETAMVPVEAAVPAEMKPSEPSVSLASFVDEKMKKKRVSRTVRLSVVITPETSDALDELYDNHIITSKNELVNILLEKYIKEARKAGLLTTEDQ